MNEMVRDFRRFLLVSVLSFGMNLGLTFVLADLVGLAEELAYAITLVSIFAVNFLMLRHYVYAHEKEGSDPFKQLIGTAAGSVGFRVGEYSAFLIFHTLLGFYYLLVIAVVTAVSFILKFFFYRQFVYRGKKSNHSDSLVD